MKNSWARLASKGIAQAAPGTTLAVGDIPMKKIIILTACGVLFAACKPTSDKVPRAEEAGARAGASSASPEAERSTTQQKLSNQLNELDAKMAELKQRAQRAGDQAKAEWEARRPQLEAQRDAAAKKLEELKQSGKESWAETSKKAEAAFGELEKGFKEAWARLKE
jgi:Skp family chaperone for outer membrane proteins